MDTQLAKSLVWITIALVPFTLGIWELIKHRDKPRPFDQVLGSGRRIRLEVAATILAGYVEHRPPTGDGTEDAIYAARAVQLADALISADVVSGIQLEQAKDELALWREAARTRNKAAMAERLGLKGGL